MVSRENMESQNGHDAECQRFNHPRDENLNINKTFEVLLPLNASLIDMQCEIKRFRVGKIMKQLNVSLSETLNPPV